MSELFYSLFRVVSFDVTWTFIDKYIPSITDDHLGDEVSISIRLLGHSPHLLNNLKGTLIAFTVLFIIAVIIPCN
jgi:hypothetical protein